MDDQRRFSPDIEAYHRSISAELHSLKDRVKNLVPHRLSQGEDKEAVLRSFLRRHMPDTFKVGRGFVVTSSGSTPQIDVLIVDATVPILFESGDLFIVGPKGVRAVIEVKTRLNGDDQVNKTIKHLVNCAQTIHAGWPVGAMRPPRPWLGLFVFDGNDNESTHRRLLQSIAEHSWRYNHIKCVVNGPNTFIRYWKSQEKLWRSYTLNNLSVSYFLGNLLLAIAADSVAPTPDLWFPVRGDLGKEQNAKFQIKEDRTEIEECRM